MFPIYIKEPEGPLPDGSIYYLLTGSGIFLVKNHPLFHSRTRVEEIAWLPSEEPGFTFCGPRLPEALPAQALAFCMHVWDRHKAESVVILYFKPGTEEFELVVPDQVVGGIHCVYEESLRESCEAMRVGTIHSHGCEDAFHSDRDNADETYQDGLHLIFGNLDTVPTLLCSAMVDGHRFSLQPEEIIDGTPLAVDLSPWRRWSEEQTSKHVKPLKKPIYFGA